MVGGVAATAAVRTFPFRVFSFPSEIKVVHRFPKMLAPGLLNPIYYNREALDVLKKNFAFSTWEEIEQSEKLVKLYTGRFDVGALG